MEVGHIFKLGTRYSEKLGATVLTADGVQTPLVMGSYGIGIDRIMAAAVEQHHDDKGISWPVTIAPFEAVVVSLGKDADVDAAAEEVAGRLSEQGIDVLYDDRDERAGVKLNDAELIGFPARVAVGTRGLRAGRGVEWTIRETGESQVVALDQVSTIAFDWIASERRRLSGE